LDITTLSILEDYLQNFPGPILTVSHDRFFLDKMADQVFEVCGSGEVRRYSGNWTDWMNKRREEEEAVKAPKPKAAPIEKPKMQSKLRFSYKEEREFAMIDGEIAALEAKIEDNQAKQATCGSDYVKLQELQDACAALEQQLEEKMDRWMYLTELKEKIDAQ
ncbi:MAG: ABC transporter ATP-binding protein, partial [Clostridia bacterium]|nr:ABC transporter ATP-binding protein [Clostridia bacterium]